MTVLNLDGLTIAYAFGISAIAWLVYKLIIYPNYVSNIRNIPGPPCPNLLNGVLPQIFKAPPGELHDEWCQKYDTTALQYRGFFGQNRLYLSDTKALNHVLVTRSYEYPKPTQLRGQLARILGRGILFAEGDAHKRQRRIMNHPFTQAQVNTYTPIFQEHSNKLREKLLAELAEPDKVEKESKGGYKVVEITRWLSKATLDVIGDVGFSYTFGALDNSGNTLAAAFNAMLKPRDIKMWMIIMQVLISIFPFLANIPTEAARNIKKTMAEMEGAGKKMLDIRKEWQAAGELDDKKDLMSLMVKANINAANKKDKMLDEELMGQITTFILAGHETSSTTLSWILWYLSTRPELQQRLRAEIREAKSSAANEGRTELSTEEITGLPLMDAILRETMRLSPPVTMTIRGAGHDDVIPLSKPIIGRDGKTIDSIPVKKGQQIMIGIYTMQRNTEIYGEDAREFRPERWLEKDKEGGGNFDLAKNFTVWSSLLTFLGGPRGCIGYRFALLEMKVILATLIDAFEFLERDEGGTAISARSNIVTRPVVVGEEKDGARLPLRMRKASA